MSYAESAEKYIAVKDDLEAARALSLNARQTQWITAGARQNMRGISTKLTGTLLDDEGRPPHRVEGVEGNELDLEIDHAVPLNLIHDRILGLDNPRVALDKKEAVKFLVDHFFCVHLTREQHRQLRGNSMPPGWEWGDDPFARYHERGLKVVGPPVRIA
jgi:hypothetical protein